MALLKALFWALIFIIRIRFPPGTSLAAVFIDHRNFVYTLYYCQRQTLSQNTYVSLCYYLPLYLNLSLLHPES